MKLKIKVVELFAGVGGFRLGLEGWNNKTATSNYKDTFESPYEVVWSNQFEPSTKRQHASEVYVKSFGPENHSNQDINEVLKEDFEQIPDHDLLVGGFPCQDYSVAKARNYSNGIEGKKGVLWWAIHAILSRKGTRKPSYLMLENVDRLLTSPAKARGRDFAILMSSLSQLGYIVEWRIVNAADYGMPQRRRRVFIFAYHKSSPIYKKYTNPNQWIAKDGVIAKAFPVQRAKKSQPELFPNLEIGSFNINGDLVEITESFNKGRAGKGAFENSGVMIDRQVWTVKTEPDYEGPQTNLKDILVSHNEVGEEFYLGTDLEKWEYLKGAKREERKKSNGEIFYYAEGPMSFPDRLDRPARTIITSEGGITPSRFKHVIKRYGKYRRLTPKELERANMFPDDHTASAKDTKRSFFMGNALVVGVIEELGKVLAKAHKS